MSAERTKLTFGKSDLGMIAVSMIWGLGTVVIKNVLGDTPDKMNVYVYNGLRLPIAAFLLFSLAKLRGRKILLQRRHIPYVLLTGFVAAVNNVALLFGIKLSSAANFGVIMGMMPLFILIFTFLLKVERPKPILFAGIVVGFMGTFVLSWRGGSFIFSMGDVLIVCGCSLLGLFTVLSRRVLDDYSTAVASGWFFILVWLYFLPFSLYYFPKQDLGAVATMTWIYFSISIIGPMFIASILYYYAIREIGPSRVGVYTYLTPVFTLLFAYLIRHEEISFQHVLGLVVIIFGVSITRAGKSRIV